ncbi:hypothetical protein Tco_0392449 [Tanacetum coccineum]
MAEEQAIVYAPQWNNMSVDNLLPSVPQCSIRTTSGSFGAQLLPMTLLVLNGQRPLTLDFNTFCSSTGLDYNNGKYVAHPTPEGPEALGALSKKRQKPKSKKPPTETKVTPPKPTEGSEQSHSVPSSSVRDPQDLERNKQLASMGLPSTLDEGTRTSQPLPEDTATHPKDSGGNVQPYDRDLIYTTSDKGTAKTTPHLEGSLRDKDLGGNKPFADIKPINPTVADHSGTGAKYQVDQTQSTRLRYQSLTENKGKPSHEGELDTQPLVLSTYPDVRAFLLYDDEAQESEEDILGAGEEMDEDHQAATIQHQYSPPQADKPQSSHAPSTRALDTDSSCILFHSLNANCWEKHQEATVNYANLKASIDEYYDENIAHRDQTDKLVEASMSSDLLESIYT